MHYVIFSNHSGYVSGNTLQHHTTLTSSRIRVERVEDVTPIVTQSTQHMNEFTNMLSQLPRSTSTSAIKSPQTNTETFFGTASTKRTATRSVITPRSLPTSHHSGITTQCTPSTRSPCDKSMLYSSCPA